MAEVKVVAVDEGSLGRAGLGIKTPEEPSPVLSKVDGSRLSWKTFRRDILAPHRIRLLETPTKRLPETLVAMFDTQSKDVSRFKNQMTEFRDQVAKGRGFGPSPLFPPNLLPAIEAQTLAARCMVPAFSRTALPERALNQLGPLYELKAPRPGLGCGFASQAFSRDEVLSMPSWAITSGTMVHFETGYISPGAMLYCPFLTFERAIGPDEENLEAANNQCAIAGAWCTRAIQMLYARAWQPGERSPELPVCFSCTISNDFAVLNYHWIDHAQAYCMSPICRFDLANDNHFSMFQVWVEVIGQWAIEHLLPNIKEALERFRTAEPASAATASPATPRALPALTLTTTELNRDELLIKSLKTNFDSVPWRFDDEEFTPVSSSTASWGSPMVADVMYHNLTYPAVPALSTRPRKPALTRSVPHSAHPGLGVATPPPAYSINTELVLQKRLGHAMDEIKDLHKQLAALREEVSGSKASIQEELTGLKTTVDSVLRKELLIRSNDMDGHDSQAQPTAPLQIETWQGSPTFPAYKFGPTRSPWAKWYNTITGSANKATSPLMKEVRFTPSPGVLNSISLSPIDEMDTPTNDIADPTDSAELLAQPSTSPITDDDKDRTKETILQTTLPQPPTPRFPPPRLPFSNSLKTPLTPGFPSPAYSIFSNAEHVVVVPPPPPPPTKTSLVRWAMVSIAPQLL